MEINLKYNWYVDMENLREDSPLYFKWDYSASKTIDGKGHWIYLDSFQVKPTRKQLRVIRNRMYKEAALWFQNNFGD